MDAQFIAKLEMLAATRMDVESMAAILECPLEEFKERRKNDELFSQAILRGRAQIVKNCASVVMLAAQGSNTVTPQQFEAAKFYLEHHEWQEK